MCGFPPQRMEFALKWKAKREPTPGAAMIQLAEESEGKIIVTSDFDGIVLSDTFYTLDSLTYDPEQEVVSATFSARHRNR